jgi:hypothetical protein
LFEVPMKADVIIQGSDRGSVERVYSDLHGALPLGSSIELRQPAPDSDGPVYATATFATSDAEGARILLRIATELDLGYDTDETLDIITIDAA